MGSKKEETGRGLWVFSRKARVRGDDGYKRIFFLNIRKDENKMRIRTRNTSKNRRMNDWHFFQIASPSVGNFFLFTSYIFIDLSIYSDILLNACIVV